MKSLGELSRHLCSTNHHRQNHWQKWETLALWALVAIHSTTRPIWPLKATFIAIDPFVTCYCDGGPHLPIAFAFASEAREHLIEVGLVDFIVVKVGPPWARDRISSTCILALGPALGRRRTIAIAFALDCR